MAWLGGEVALVGESYLDALVPCDQHLLLLFLNISCQCEVCDRPFCNYESDIFSETVTKCVFCRMDAKGSLTEASSSLGGEDSPLQECSPTANE